MKEAFPPYSVLYSIYEKERPEWLCESVDSMLGQTVKPNEIVFVKDGPLTPELEDALSLYDAENPGLFKFVGYPDNQGLGYALQQGVLACSNEIIARMDTDDYSFPDRMELQLRQMRDDDLDMVGSQIIEFITSPDKPIAKTDLPESMEAIQRYSKRRNPFRHSAIVFNRDKVLEVGNYSSNFLFFEDWDLFNRMLAAGDRAENNSKALVGVRVNEDFYGRRGSKDYLPFIWRFKKEQLRNGYFTIIDFFRSFVPHAIVCVMPTNLRAWVYRKLLRR